MVNNKERQNYYDKTELVSRLLREILRRVSRVLSFVSVSRNPRQAIRNLNSFNNYFLLVVIVVVVVVVVLPYLVFYSFSALILIIVSTDCLSLADEMTKIRKVNCISL